MAVLDGGGGRGGEVGVTDDVSAELHVEAVGGDLVDGRRHDPARSRGK